MSKRRPAGVTRALMPGPVLALSLISLQAFEGPAYVGNEACARCHVDRARQHAGSNFAGSWRPVSALPDEVSGTAATEEGISYRVEKKEGRWVYHVQLPRRPVESHPVHSLIGGERFGLSFILDVSHLQGQPLARPVLVEARYMLDAGTGRLRLSPGFPQQTPASYETALGRVMSREFAEECLNCHGGMTDRDLALAGGPHPRFNSTAIGCERCHGPGGDHVGFFQTGEGEPSIVNPAKLSHARVLELCGQCHSGFFAVPQPRPQDLLISSQATALASSECYIQSGAGFSCISCHDPHRNAVHDDPVYQQTCLGCHGEASPSGRICPVNPAGGCIDCHMPLVRTPGNFELVDHWIRPHWDEGTGTAR